MSVSYYDEERTVKEEELSHSIKLKVESIRTLFSFKCSSPYTCDIL